MTPELKNSQGLPGGEVGMGGERGFQIEGTGWAGMSGDRYRGVFKNEGLVLCCKISDFFL